MYSAESKSGHAALNRAGDAAATNVDTVDGGALVFVVVTALVVTGLDVTAGRFAAVAEHPAAAATTKATAMSLLGKRMSRILPDLRGDPGLGYPLVIIPIVPLGAL
ncbi:hypothetical protein [Amycolatopsis sp. NPDC051372]|uniref:hypothetical protein n=1 Tax=Amycolatopsis sp. NPDC051372 TaxID=3155669 RepID=UPI00343DB1E6